MTFRSGDLQSDSDLDSIRSSWYYEYDELIENNDCDQVGALRTVIPLWRRHWRFRTQDWKVMMTRDKDTLNAGQAVTMSSMSPAHTMPQPAIR